MEMEFLLKVKAGIEAAEREAAAMMLQAHDIMPESKTDARNVVTEYDCKVQAYLVEKLSELVPGACFFCEENNMQDSLTNEHVFIIDPIDGTMNFVHGLRHSCISVAYASRGELLAGAVYNPYQDEMYSGVKDGGAFLNGKRMKVDDAGLKQSLVLCGTAPYNPSLTDKTFEIMKKSFNAGLDIRRQGAAALDVANVAAGRAGLFFELETCLWDVAAGLVLLREAGGICMRFDGEVFEHKGGKQSVIVAGEKTYKDFAEMIKE